MAEETNLYKLHAKDDGLWLELNGSRYKGMIKINTDGEQFVSKAGKEVWQAIRAKSERKG